MSFGPRPSPWGYNWTAEDVQRQPQNGSCEVDPQLAHMPAALLSTLRREKKPFTYTPGGVDLSEVLNQRLQKRLERKKRYQEAPKQVVVTPTYNTPLDMYSVQNALEVLEVQAELADTRSSTLPRNHTFRFAEEPSRGVAQSKAFRVLQIMTDTEEDAAGKPRPQHQDEMRFTGIRDSSAIPSRFFHALQKITGTEEERCEEQQRMSDVSGSPQQRAPDVSSVSPQQRLPNSQSLHLQGSSAPHHVLRRPAAFLPEKLANSSGLPGFRPVRSPCAAPKPAAGTDF